MNHLFVLVFTVILAGCQSDIYLRNGVTNGDTFFLAPLAHASDDPSVASWVRYSLILSTCQLQIGGELPSRNSSFDCEFTARQHLVEAWQELRLAGQQEDEYLDSLLDVKTAGFLAEYTAHYFNRSGWALPSDLEAAAFTRWRKEQLAGHRPQTRLVGHWGYRRNLAALP